MKCIKHVDFINLPFLSLGQRYIHCWAQQAFFSLSLSIVAESRKRSEWFQNECQQKLRVYSERHILKIKWFGSLSPATLLEYYCGVWIQRCAKEILPLQQWSKVFLLDVKRPT